MEYMVADSTSASTSVSARNDPQAGRAYHASWTAYVQAPGAVRDHEGAAAVCSCPRPGQRSARATAGGKSRMAPYADSKERMGGYFILDVPDLDVALDCAARCPAEFSGSVEIRPVMVMQPR